MFLLFKLVALLTIFGSISNSLISIDANAAVIPERAYARQQFVGTNVQGKSVILSTGQEDLTSAWSSTNVNSFINKEMWLMFNDNEWIEVGQTKGAVNSTYWNGHFQATKRYYVSCNCWQFSEYKVGNSGPTGSHQYAITYEGNSTWNVYVDYQKIDYWTFTNTKAMAMQIGIETNDTLSKFKTGTTMTGAQLLQSKFSNFLYVR